MYRIKLPDEVRQQLAALPPTAPAAFAEVMVALEVASWGGDPYNRERPEGNIRADEGWVTLTPTTTIVNCPVLGFNQPTVTGSFRNTGVKYLDEGPILLAKGANGPSSATSTRSGW